MLVKFYYKYHLILNFCQDGTQYRQLKQQMSQISKKSFPSKYELQADQPLVTACCTISVPSWDLPPDKKTVPTPRCNPKKLILILPLQLVNKKLQSAAMRVTMTYGTRLSTKFYSLHCVQYCKNNFNNIIEHVAIKDSNTVLYVGVIISRS